MNMDDDAEIIAAARAGFLDEAADMLAQFEQALLVMESDPEDSENLNAAFRAAHTIKGTAGLFGFDRVVHFTHEAETLLESLRAGELTLDQIRPHELLNYFTFDATPASGGELFGVHASAEQKDRDSLSLALTVQGATPPRAALARARSARKFV